MVMKLGSQWLVSKWMVEAPFKEWHYFKTVLHIVLVIFKKGEIITCACFNLIYNLFLIMWIFFSPEEVNIIKNIICIFINFEKKNDFLCYSCFDYILNYKKMKFLLFGFTKKNQNHHCVLYYLGKGLCKRDWNYLWSMSCKVKMGQTVPM